jgi:regulator of sigma E protease
VHDSETLHLKLRAPALYSAVINFLPIPVVDGGHAVFLLIEKIMGRPVPVQIQNVITMLGWALILFLFILLTWNDIVRILSNL